MMALPWSPNACGLWAIRFLQDLRKSIEICPPTPNSGGARDQSSPELGDLGGECVSPILVILQMPVDT